jgi:hypothetical protein
MPVVAIAFHDSVAQEKLHELFATDEIVARSITKTLTCPKCKVLFAVVLPQKEDPRNDWFVDALQVIICEDCINGIHKEEYAYEVPPEVPN